jgi:2-polyprenyl-6-methoxyphenol hydroxylase-like FAD-dependent oxidoreductase
MKVGIVGAGIGGMAAAVALRRRGIESYVYEEAARPREVGAGLHLWANAVRALREIGLGEPVERIAVPIESERIYADSGELLVEWPVGDLSRELGIPSVGVARPDLLHELVEAAGDAVVGDHRCTGFSQDAGGVTLEFEGGRSERCDFLVGADGLHSTVRTELHGAHEPRYLGYTSWRTLVPTEAGERPGGGVRLHQYWGQGSRCVFFPAGASGSTYLVCLANAPHGEEDVGGEPTSRLLATYGGFPDPIPELIAAAPESSWVRTDITDRLPLRRWGAHRATLLGDAAHPMAPNASQGAGMALEDAAVLAHELADRGTHPGALRAYERRRRGRVNFAVGVSWFPGLLGRVKRPRAVRLRNEFIRRAFAGPSWSRNAEFIAAEF